MTKSVLLNFAILPVLPFLNISKDLDPSYKMDLDFWDCFGRKKTLSYNRRNMVAAACLVDFDYNRALDKREYVMIIFLIFH